MSHYFHHAIVVTAVGPIIEILRIDAERHFPWVSSISTAGANGHRSFFVPPDGSKEGYSPSRVADELRSQFFERLEWHRKQGAVFDWVEVGFGENALNLAAVSVRTKDVLARMEQPRAVPT